MIWQGILALCKSKAAITDQIGSDPIRMWPVKLPQGVNDFPAVAVKNINISPTRSFDGDEGLDDSPYDIHCYGKTQEDAEATAKIIRDELEGSSGTFGGVEFTDVEFRPSGGDDYLKDLELYTYSIEVEFDVRR